MKWIDELKVDDYVYDSSMNCYGIVKDISDMHNVFVEYEDCGGSGLYCLDYNCKEFDPSLKLIKKS